MGVSENSVNSAEAPPSEHHFDGKGLGDAVTTETSVFKRSTTGATFDNDSSESFYKPIDTYEGIHRYDPQFEWEPKEEQRVVRKVR